MQIFVRSISGESFPLQIGDFRTVGELGAAIEVRPGCLFPGYLLCDQTISLISESRMRDFCVPFLSGVPVTGPANLWVRKWIGQQKALA